MINEVQEISLEKRKDEAQELLEHIGLVHKISKKFTPTVVVDSDDNFQNGAIGLLEAIRKYNPDKGKLSTYAWPAIYHSILSGIEKDGEFGETHFDIPPWTDLLEDLPNSLSLRELKIVTMLIEGYKIKEIAKEVGINLWTFRETIKNIIEKVRDGSKMDR